MTFSSLINSYLCNNTCYFNFKIESFRKHAHVINKDSFSAENNGKFHWKNIHIFNIYAQNIDCGYTLGPRRF